MANGLKGDVCSTAHCSIHGRESVIGYRTTGYLCLYAYSTEHAVLVRYLCKYGI